jgi:TRAP-type C4-dicarboxylate transport system permease large subunit
MLAWILMGALFFSRFMALTGASEQIVIAIAALPIGKYGIFALLVVLFLFLGCFLEPLPMMAITLPVVHPLIKQLGLDPIWFGVVLQVLVGCGMITPPFGFNVFGVKALIGDAAELMAIFKAALPFLIAMLLMILILTIFPQIALFLPEMMA